MAQTPPQVTAQFVQTPQGLRIIVRGIQGASIPKHQLNKLVRAELLEVQAEAKRLCQVPPTKITINLPPSLLQYKQLKASLAKMVQVHQERLRKDILTKWALLRENESMLIQHKVKETLWDLHIQHGQERDRGAHQVRRGQRHATRRRVQPRVCPEDLLRSHQVSPSPLCQVSLLDQLLYLMPLAYGFLVALKLSHNTQSTVS